VNGALVVTVSAAPLAVAADPPGDATVRALLSAGIPVASRQVVDQDDAALEAALRHALEAYPFVVVLAGAGGSDGDIVRRTLARVTSTRLVLNERLLHALEERFRQQDRAMPRRAERLALLPQGATPWCGPGGEPGWLLETPTAAMAVLPAGGSALAGLLESHLLPCARERFRGSDVVLVRTLRTVGARPADLDERLAPFLGNEADMPVATIPVGDEVWVRLQARGPSRAVAADALAAVEAEIRARLGPDCYGSDGDTLEAVVGRTLLDRGLMLAVAESCTGGLVGHRITNVPGSSRYFERGVMVYSNRAKQELLGVPESVLRVHGAVSAACAEAMARGVCALARTPCGLAITGIAGPDGGSVAKPVGTVFIGLALEETVQARRFLFPGNREAVKWQSSQMALDMLRRALLARESEWVIEPR
jgi:nicotinamide-nucleotide amidase